MANMLLEFRYLLTNLISQGIGYQASSIYIIMGIILTTFRNLRTFTRTEPHMQLTASLNAQLCLNIMSNLCGIHKRNIQTMRHITRSYDIGSVSINECITIYLLFTRKSSLSQFLVIIILHWCLIETSAHYRIKQNRDTTFGTCFLDKTLQIGIKGRAWICMTVGMRLFIIVTKLNKHIIPRFQLIQYFLPSTFIDKTLRTSTIHSMVINDDFIIKTTLQYHTPSSFWIILGITFLSSSRITYHKDGRYLTARCQSEHQKQAGKPG